MSLEAGVAKILAQDHQSVIAIHLMILEWDLDPVVDNTELSDAERSYLAVNRSWDMTERGYSAIQSTKPQTVGYGLNDSPAGLAAYVGEKWHSWSDVTPTDDFLVHAHPVRVRAEILVDARYWASLAPGRSHIRQHALGFWCFAHQTVPEGECHARIWSAYTTSGSGHLRAAVTSPRLRNRRRSQGI